MNARFAKSCFLASTNEERQQLCAELAEAAARRIIRAASLHEKALHIVRELRALGHDLWSHDEADDFSVWGPNYVEPTGAGIVVHFELENVRVDWTQQ